MSFSPFKRTKKQPTPVSPQSSPAHTQIINSLRCLQMELLQHRRVTSPRINRSTTTTTIPTLNPHRKIFPHHIGHSTWIAIPRSHRAFDFWAERDSKGFWSDGIDRVDSGTVGVRCRDFDRDRDRLLFVHLCSVPRC
ncbi:hypothetical protein AKJ16_DCAP21531 [Drosera capensis]